MLLWSHVPTVLNDSSFFLQYPTVVLTGRRCAHLLSVPQHFLVANELVRHAVEASDLRVFYGQIPWEIPELQQNFPDKHENPFAIFDHQHATFTPYQLVWRRAGHDKAVEEVVGDLMLQRILRQSAIYLVCGFFQYYP